MKRIALSLLAASLLVGALALPAFASDTCNDVAADTLAQPRAALCEECGLGEVRLISQHYGPWITVDWVDCSTGAPQYKDAYQERTHYMTYQCDYCGAGFTNESTETRTIHDHAW